MSTNDGIYRRKILSRIGYVTRLISSLCQECSDYLLRIRFYTYTIFHITITLNLIQSNVSISVQLYLGQCWTSTIFNGDHPKTLLRMQSPSYICGRCHAMNLLLSPWILLLVLQQSYCYFLGNGLRRFHRSVSSGFQHVTIYQQEQTQITATNMNLYYCDAFYQTPWTGL
jgi:hypothetical protein